MGATRQGEGVMIIATLAHIIQANSMRQPARGGGNGGDTAGGEGVTHNGMMGNGATHN